jgi:hypothetical protein
MSGHAEWLESNSRYLAAAIHCLKLRLKRTTEAQSDAPASLAAEEIVLAEAELGQIASEMEFPPAIRRLSGILGLTEFEENILLLCAALEFDTAVPTLCARVPGNVGRESATFALAFQLFDGGTWDALSPERPLRYWRLVELNQPGSQPLTAASLRADERIVNYIKGLSYLDDRLAPYLASCESPIESAHLPTSQQETAALIAGIWQQGPESHPLTLVQLPGPDRTSKLLVASHAAASMGCRLYRLSGDSLPTQASDVDWLARLWQRESALLPLALFVDADPEGPSPDLHFSAVRSFLSRTDGLLFLGVREAWPSAGRESVVFDIAKPTPSEQRAEWQSVLGPAQSATAALLSAQFNLNCSDIRAVARATGFGGRPLINGWRDHLWDACRARVRPLLDTLAFRIDAKAMWDDIVIPRDEMSLLRQIASQVKHRSQVYGDWGFRGRMNRGMGITVLFCGDSGTGKTMAAEVLANELRLNLYRIDLSSVVSKYIGETEKNLRRLFDAAEDGGAILFFDEADALFGKRSEVKDSHDRYANIEVNYLLQRMEAYCGLAILATNLRSALDTAFTRRLRFIVSFPFPSVTDRRRMWQQAFPPKTPVTSLDYDRLGRLNLSGGGISNAALNAAFLAAQSGTPVDMGAVLTAARQELVKLDRPVNEADFRWQTVGDVVA